MEEATGAEITTREASGPTRRLIYCFCMTRIHLISIATRYITTNVLFTTPSFACHSRCSTFSDTLNWQSVTRSSATDHVARVQSPQAD